jgi:hypothetical protein
MDDLAGGGFHDASRIGKSQFLVLMIISPALSDVSSENATAQIPAAVSPPITELSLNCSRLARRVKQDSEPCVIDVRDDA